MTATHYNSSSKGPTLISGMEYKHLVNSLNILVTRQPHRTDEIEAMTAEVAKRDVDYALGIGATSAAPAEYEPTHAERLAMGGNFPPEELKVTADPAEVAAFVDAFHEVADAVDAAAGPDVPNVAAYWSSLEISLRNADPLVALGKIKTTAAAITKVDDEAEAKTAGEAIVELKRVRQLGEAAGVAEKAPILAASRVCDEFARPFKALDAEQKRLERLTGGYQLKVAAQRQAQLKAAADAEREKAQKLLNEAAAQETKGADIVGDILLDHATKGDDIADMLDARAAGPVSDLGRVMTETVSLGLKAPWTAEITDLVALRTSLGILGAYLTPDAMLTASKAYVRANVSDGRFIGSELPGVRVFQDVRGTAR